jgi:predicted lipid carrier protein YhbT
MASTGMLLITEALAQHVLQGDVVGLVVVAEQRQDARCMVFIRSRGGAFMITSRKKLVGSVR